MNGRADNGIDFGLAPTLSVKSRRIGTEQEPLVLIDDVLRHPEQLVDYAAREVEFAPVCGPEGGYPGIRAPAPLDYVESVVRGLGPAIAKAFGLGDVTLARAECSFSLVTLLPDQLAPLQRIPHIDTVDPLQFAILHYLCEPGFGGTAFYRHRATGFETLDEERNPHYEKVRRYELAEAAPCYIQGDTRHYLQIAAVEAAFNRLVVYRSRLLHSAQIRTPEQLSADPRSGRLTANIFLNYRPA